MFIVELERLATGFLQQNPKVYIVCCGYLAMAVGISAKEVNDDILNSNSFDCFYFCSVSCCGNDILRGVAHRSGYDVVAQCCRAFDPNEVFTLRHSIHRCCTGELAAARSKVEQVRSEQGVELQMTAR